MARDEARSRRQAPELGVRLRQHGRSSVHYIHDNTPLSLLLPFFQRPARHGTTRHTTAAPLLTVTHARTRSRTHERAHAYTQCRVVRQLVGQEAARELASTVCPAYCPRPPDSAHTHVNRHLTPAENLAQEANTTPVSTHTRLSAEASLFVRSVI